MTDLRTAAKQALDYIRSTTDYKMGHPPACEAALDLADALAEPQGESVAIEWDEVYDCATAAYCRSPSSKDALRICFQSRDQHHQVSIGWTANELMDFAKGIARLYTTPQPKAEPWTPRELELIDGMIEVQLNHAERCDRIANRTMAEKQKGWDMERVALLRKIRGTAPRPAKREPLTDEELGKIINANWGVGVWQMARAIEDAIWSKT